MINMENPIPNPIVENAQTVEEVVAELAANKHQIKSIRRNLIFTQYITDALNDNNSNVFNSTVHRTQHACFILPSSEEAERAVYNYINNHCKCFVDLVDFAKELYSKNPDYIPMGIFVSLGIHPIRLNDHNPIHLNRYYEYTVHVSHAVRQSYYLDLNGRTLKEVADEWLKSASALVIKDIKIGRQLFFKLIKHASTINDSVIVVDDKVEIKFDDVYSTGYEEENVYAIIRIGSETFIAGTDVEMYIILERQSHLIGI